MTIPSLALLVFLTGQTGQVQPPINRATTANGAWMYGPLTVIPKGNSSPCSDAPKPRYSPTDLRRIRDAIRNARAADDSCRACGRVLPPNYENTENEQVERELLTYVSLGTTAEEVEAFAAERWNMADKRNWPAPTPTQKPHRRVK